jgi:hypothetical protein
MISRLAASASRVVLTNRLPLFIIDLVAKLHEPLGGGELGVPARPHRTKPVKLSA